MEKAGPSTTTSNDEASAATLQFELRGAITALRTAQPTMGVKKLCAELKKQACFADVKTKQIREVLEGLNMRSAQPDCSTTNQTTEEPVVSSNGGDQASSQENRAQRRARLKAESSRNKKVIRHGPGEGDRGDPHAANRLAVTTKAFTTDVTPPDEYEDTPLSLEMKQKLDEFMDQEKRDGLVPPIQVSKLNLYFMENSLKLQDEKEEIRRQYKLESAIMRNSRDAKRIATASLRCEHLKQRSYAYNANQQAFEKCRVTFMNSASKKAHGEYIMKNYHVGEDGVLMDKQELEEDAALGDVSHILATLTAQTPTTALLRCTNLRRVTPHGLFTIECSVEWIVALSLQFEKLSQELRAEGLGFGSSLAAARSAPESVQEVEPEPAQQVDRQGIFEDMEIQKSSIATLAALTKTQHERNKKTTDKALKQLSPEQYEQVKQLVKARQDAEQALKETDVKNSDVGTSKGDV